jgi:hypothetical protein
MTRGLRLAFRIARAATYGTQERDLALHVGIFEDLGWTTQRGFQVRKARVK